MDDEPDDLGYMCLTIGLDGVIEVDGDIPQEQWINMACKLSEMSIELLECATNMPARTLH